MNFDIVIVGGGLVGASLACALRESGLRIAVVEAVALKSDAQPSFNERTVALAFGSRRVYQAIGVWHEVERLGVTPIERIHVSHRGWFGATRLAADELALPALGYVVENRVLGAALLKTLEHARDVTWHCPATVDDIQAEHETVRLAIKQEGVVHELSARLVIGADGTHSAVRRMLGLEAERSDYGQVAIVATVAAGLAHRNTAYERFTPTGPLAALPMRDNRLAIVWSARADEADTLLGWSDAEFIEQLQRRFGDRLGRFSQPGARTRYPLGLTRVPRQLGTRAVLIGNAAHTVHPVAGQGFNLGLRDAAALAEVLVNAAHAGEDIGGSTVLHRYGDWRRRDTRVTEIFTDTLVRVFSSDFAPLAVARGAGLVALDLMPPVKRRLLRVTSGLGGRLPRLGRGLSL